MTINPAEIRTGDKICGFEITGIRDIEEIDGRLIEMTHVRTGAGLVWADSHNENKLFSVGFRTLPEDSTGVFHILEHSVLCGSEKYPVKEPFVELLKSSMNTFLNAMTYPDKTLYPVSSKIEQDYLNLAGVYLDAVFRPNLLSNPYIFYQEGWHIDTAGEEPAYKGVVFNEMKGAMSDVDQVAENNLGRLLFPDSCYGYNSGGDPEVIPDLTYDDYVARYQKFYHPSNAYFYLDGDIPLEKTLEMIEEYLQGYDRRDDIPEITMQETKVSEDTVRYAASGSDDKAMIVFGRIAGTWEDRDKLLALSVLTEHLADSNESPLKRAVLSSGLAEDMEIYVSDGIAQPYIAILFRGVDPDHAAESGDRLISIVRETVREEIERGLPRRDLEASANQLEFRFRQYPEPQALYRASAVLNSWLYGGDPAMNLMTNEAITALRGMIADDALASLAEEYFTDTSLYSRLTLLPSAELEAEQAAEEASRVRAEVSAMDEAGLAELEELNSGLLKWQESQDSDEDLASIPQLELSDISPVPELIGTEVSEIDGVTVLYHQIPTSGIVYINAYFPVTDLTLEELPAAALVTEFYKDLPTENYSVTELASEIKRYTGSVSFGIDMIARDDDNSVCTPCLRARASVLKENLSHAEDLIIEILTRTRFDDRTLMRELVTQIDEEGKRYAVSSGHRLAIYAARSGYSARDAASEAVNGYTFIQYMHKMNAEFESQIDGFIAFARDLISRAVVRESCAISITASEYSDPARLISMLGSGCPRPAAAAYTSPLPCRMGIQVPAAVSHSVQAYDLSEISTKPRGSLSTAANILTFSYLWNEIRVKGGAYGTSVSASRTGSFFAYSYRDPSPARTLGIYGTLADFLGAFAGQDDMDIDGLIISTIASTEPLVSPASKGRAADDFWFSGFTDEDRIRVRGEILSTTMDDLRSWCDAFTALAANGRVCVIGPKTALDTCEGLEIYNI